MKKQSRFWLPILLVCFATVAANAQSFRVQCPTSTITHPSALTNVNAEPAYNGPTQFNPPAVGVPVGTTGDFATPKANVNGAIKCQQISGGDGYMTEADGTQTFMFSFGPLSGLADIAAGHSGTEPPNVFNTIPDTTTVPNGRLVRGDPATSDGATSGASPGTVFTSNGTYAPAFTYNGAVGLTNHIPNIVTVTNIVEGDPGPAVLALSPGTPQTFPPGSDYCTGLGSPAPGAHVVTVYTDSPVGVSVGEQIVINNKVTGVGATPMDARYAGTFTVTCVNNSNVVDPAGMISYILTYNSTYTGLPADTGNNNAGTAAIPAALDGHVDTRPIMDVGPMNGNIPAPLVAFDEDDEFFLTLTNVGMIMRPDLFEQHTVHFHGYPNASSFYDGVPDASVAINIGASFTYYYLAPDAGTYFWHCHITPPEHLQMGMVGQLHVRPRQDRVPAGKSLYTYLGYQNGIGLPANTVADLRTVCNPGQDILCSATMPFGGATANTALQGTDKLSNPQRYAYNDGDGSTAYDTEYPIQMHGFDPNFHFVGMTFNPEMFVDMKDKYFLLNGRSYPDTVGQCGAGVSGFVTGCAPGPQATISSDGQMHYSQPLPALVNIPAGGKALLRLVNLSVTEYHTLQSLGIPMKEVGFNAKLLRDQAGLNTEFYTNSVTLGGGESLDVILDASDAGCGSVGCAAKLYPAGSTFYLYTPQLDHLSNDAENFGGMMTEVHICNSVSGGNTFGNTCK